MLAIAGIPRSVKWEIIADNLRKAGWSWGCMSAIESCRAHMDRWCTPRCSLEAILKIAAAESQSFKRETA